ncbi:MAG TPA: 2-C-methyl-D-erythritol 4-phosphate cytidylyltransferase [bacterium]|nr:2-C-methyl-D-erythritol 4-phosphate cytidylyltransferase [bacterium]
MKVTVIIPAAGSGRRMGGKVAKPFLNLQGKPVLIHVLSVFQACSAVHELIVAASKDVQNGLEPILNDCGICRPVRMVPGGVERQDSVRNAVRCISSDSEAVLVHDGVRPLVSRDLINRVIAALESHSAVVPALPVRDTLKRVWEGRVMETVSRAGLWQAQTPQGFRRELLAEAHEKALEDRVYGTDDASLVERLGISVHVLEGEVKNIKITTPEDYRLAQVLMEE